jgi:hypothetical protein
MGIIDPSFRSYEQPDEKALLARIEKTWNEWSKRVSQTEMRILEATAREVAMLTDDEGSKSRWRTQLNQFGDRWGAFKETHDAWAKGTWTAKMGTPTNPLGALWPRAYGTGWEVPGDICRLDRMSLLQFPSATEDASGLLACYALLAVIHDIVLPGCPRINDGSLPERLCKEVWSGFADDIEGEGPPRIERGLVEVALEGVKKDLQPEPRRLSPERHEQQLSEQRSQGTGGADERMKASGAGPTEDETPAMSREGKIDVSPLGVTWSKDKVSEFERTARTLGEPKIVLPQAVGGPGSQKPGAADGAGEKPGKVASGDEEPVKSHLPDDATLSPTALAKAFDVPEEPLRGRLKRLRAHDSNCFIEATNRKSTEPQFLYKVGRVRGQIEDLKKKTSSKASGNRPAPRKRA